MSTLRTGTLFIVLSLTLAPLGGAQEKTGETPAELSKRVTQLAALVEKLQSRVDELEAKLGTSVVAAAESGPADSAPEVQPVAAPQQMATTPAAAPQRTGAELLGGTTVNFLFDGYYGYNFNNPIGRVNLLRAYDVSSNAFSLNQADIVLDHPADPDHGKRFGLRLDLQFGQATATLQGNANNEPRPDVYRNIFQAYGTYVVPVGNGLTVDFGKWASSLGMEGNYTQDQMNYSRSLLFDLLPFYHMGARVNYKVNDVVALNYWITNGTQQVEPFNGFKDEMVGMVITPHKTFTWTVNYYLGMEHPDVEFLANYTGTGLPTQQGLAFQPIPNSPHGKLHIFDSYFSWQTTAKLSFAWEGDYVIERLYENSAPQHVSGAAAYARYQFTPKFDLAARAEYISDHGGLFTGVNQVVKEQTFTAERVIANGMTVFAEWRRDASNHPFFLTNTLGALKKEQDTATLGIVWWFGGKQGPW
jgi:Putative beta-barrel porin-2, OmpL-like. bbp2